MQTIEGMIVRFPKLAAIVDDGWLRLHPGWFESSTIFLLPWFEQLEHDLGILDKHVDRQRLITCYRKDLRNQVQFIQTCYAIHGAALLAQPATAVHLHVPGEKGSEKNFDIRVEIQGRVVNADSKTRMDKLSFLHLPQQENGPEQENKIQPEDEDEIIGKFGSRAIIDPHDAGELGLPVSSPAPGEDREQIPESTRIRQIFLDCLSQGKMRVQDDTILIWPPPAAFHPGTCHQSPCQ